MIKWFDLDEKQKNCIVTIYDSNITLNKYTCNYLTTAYTVMLGLDYSEKLLYIKPLNKDIATRGDIPTSSQYKITIGGSYGRISNVDFIKEIKTILGVESLKIAPKKFNVEFIENNSILKIDLKREV